MRFATLSCRLALFGAMTAAVGLIAPIAPVTAQPTAYAAASHTTLTYVAGSSVKLEQIIGDCDWAHLASTGLCMQTASQTISRYDIEGNGLGYSFEGQNKLLFLFGDTIGTRTNYHGHDPIGWSTSTNPEAGLLLNFYTNTDGSPLFVEPPGIKMGPDDVPNSGIFVNNKIYLVCNTGSDVSLSNPHAHDYSVLASFDDTTDTFSTGRTISTIPGGHFIINSLHTVPAGIGTAQPGVALFGLGDYRATDVYLAVVPASQIESGQGTVYFAGISHGRPVWTSKEASAVPVVVDNPLNGPAWPHDKPTIGNVSVTYSRDVGLWLMTYDGGRQSDATTGVYFTYATAPWGPWSKPQLIFNAKRDHGFGVFIHNQDYHPPGPAGPTIGNNDPSTTRGGDFAPQMIERFTKLTGNTLAIYYTMSTWNPYTVVKMRSSFKVTH